MGMAANAWDPYIDMLTSGYAHCQYAAIFAKDRAGPGRMYAHSADDSMFPLTGEEAGIIGLAFKAENFEQVAEDGLTVGGVRYPFLRNDKFEGLALFKRKINNEERILTFAATKTLVLACFHPNQAEYSQGTMNKEVQMVQEYLISATY